MCTRKHNPSHHVNFIKQPRKNCRLNNVVCHKKCEAHQDPIKREGNLREGSIMTNTWRIVNVFWEICCSVLMHSSLCIERAAVKALAVQADVEHKTLEACFQLIYECAEQRWLHHTSYMSLIQICKRMGCFFFNAQNMSFTWEVSLWKKCRLKKAYID